MPEMIRRKEAISQGLRKYFTGKPCRKGHISERAIGGDCLECQHLRQIPWKQRSRSIHERQRKWRAKNKERINEQRRLLYWKNVELERAKLRVLARKHKDKRRTYQKRWMSNHREHMRKKENDRYRSDKRQEWVKNYRQKRLKCKQAARQKSARESAIELGMKRYFTGQPCKNGHVAERLVRNYTCVQCVKDGPPTPKDEKQWLRKNQMQLRALKRILRAKASRSQNEASTPAQSSPA